MGSGEEIPLLRPKHFPSPRPSPHRGEGEKAVPCIASPQRGEGEKAVPYIPSLHRGEGEKDGCVLSPLPYGERVRVRGITA